MEPVSDGLKLVQEDVGWPCIFECDNPEKKTARNWNRWLKKYSYKGNKLFKLPNGKGGIVLCPKHQPKS